MHVAALFVHPLKSGRAVALDEVEIEPRGPRDDRLWMAVDEGGIALTQRTEPRLALVVPRKVEDGWVLAADGNGEVLLRHDAAEAGAPVGSGGPGGRRGPDRSDGSGRRERVSVWGDAIDALRAAPEADAWLSAFLERPVRLVTMDSAARRLDPRTGREERATRFADVLPLLVVSQASLDDLNARLPARIPMDRFRPNIVVTGCEPFDEDLWRVVRVGPVEIELTLACARCAIPTTDQRTAARDPGGEPLRTLATYRRTTRADVEVEPNAVHFGWRSTPRTSGTVRVGDPVTVLARRPERSG